LTFFTGTADQSMLAGSAAKEGPAAMAATASASAVFFILNS
jgi:hypothetical protein